MNKDPESIAQAARELVERWGRNAVEVARGRVSAEANLLSRDVTLLILTEVERLVAQLDQA